MAGSITLSQNDIDQILLAKGAIRAGIDVLMDYLKVIPVEIEEVLIAGAFGSYMHPENAMRIGMLPEIPLSRIRAVGNAAGTGARMMLISKSARQKADDLAKRIEYLELTVYPEFPYVFCPRDPGLIICKYRFQSISCFIIPGNILPKGY